MSSVRLFRRAIFAIVFACVFSAGVVQADSHENSSVDVGYRQKLMEIIGTNMGSIGDILKNRMALPGHIASHASQMAASAKLIAPAFKKNAESAATDAQPEIWADWSKFEAAIDDFEEAARNLETAASGDDPAAVGAATKALGQTCGGCHKPFRKPKEESYKLMSRGHEEK